MSPRLRWLFLSLQESSVFKGSQTHPIWNKDFSLIIQWLALIKLFMNMDTQINGSWQEGDRGKSGKNLWRSKILRRF